jgi:hypothetical protein
VAGIDVPLLVGAPELAVAAAFEHAIAGMTEEHDVLLAVAIDVERVGAGGVEQVLGREPEIGAFGPAELECGADRRAVDVKRRRVRVARQHHVRQPVAIAVERSAAAAGRQSRNRRSRCLRK